MTVSLPCIPDIVHKLADGYGFYDDFHYYVSSDFWTTTAPDSGTATVGDAAGGRLTLAPSDGTVADNDEIYVASTNELFLPAANKPISLGFRLQYTEANTDDANLYFGLAQEAAANLLVDDGAGPATTLDGVGFYKVDGGTRWQVISSNDTSQTKTDTEETAGGTSFQTLHIDILPKDSADADVIFWIDTGGGKDLHQVRENGANPRTPAIKHTLSLSGLAEMHVVMGAKNGDTNNESIVIDYAWAWAKR